MSAVSLSSLLSSLLSTLPKESNSINFGVKGINIFGRLECHILLVYVIGLHAVQFGNNWLKKIQRTAKIGRGRNLAVRGIFESNYFQIGQACSPLSY